MGTCIALVANEHDNIWKASSEKFPHMTLLYYGEMTDEERAHVVEFVEHLASMTSPMYVESGKREVLGDKNADVLMVKDNRGLQLVKNLMTQLRQDPIIARGYASADQYDQWTPHITLGYPDKPAPKQDEPPYLGHIHFDRIAVWVDDYEGPIFDLEEDQRAMEAAWSEDGLRRAEVEAFLEHAGVKGMHWGVRKEERPLETLNLDDAITKYDRGVVMTHMDLPDVEDFLAHYGTKGMKWGVRKESLGVISLTGDGNRAIVSKTDQTRLSKAESKAAYKDLDNLRSRIFSPKDGVCSPHGEMRQLNAKWAEKYPNGVRPSKKIMNQYDKEAAAAFESAAKRHLPSNVHVKAVVNKDYATLVVSSSAKEVQDFVDNLRHADSQPSVLKFKLDRDESGFIINGSPEGLKHSDPLVLPEVEDFLAHFGVKGMRWGVRRDQSEGSSRGILAGRKKRSGEDGDGKEIEAKQNEDGSISIKGRSFSKADVGTTAAITGPDGKVATFIKKEDGNWHETKLSVDAESFVRTMAKESHEMSTREIKEAVARADAINKYNETFGPQANTELRRKVADLRVQKEYASLKAELNPSRLEQVRRFIDRSNAAYESYQKLDKTTGGKLSGQIKTAYGADESSKGVKIGTPPKREPFVANVRVVPTKEWAPGSGVNKK